MNTLKQFLAVSLGVPVSFYFENIGGKFWALGDIHTRGGGFFHRDGGLPAVEYANGDKAWWVNGKRHREPLPGAIGVNPQGAIGVNPQGAIGVAGLPAVEYANGDKEWWFNGIRYYPDRIWNRQSMTPDMLGQTCVISLETIQADSEVCKCDVCGSLSFFEAMKQWIVINETCPHCRSNWTSRIVYKN